VSNGAGIVTARRPADRALLPFEPAEDAHAGADEGAVLIADDFGSAPRRDARGVRA
jgi:hypothetical protein